MDGPNPMRYRLLRRLARVRSKLDSLPFLALVFTAVPLAILLALSVAAVLYAYQQVAEQLALSRDEELARISADRLSENMADFVRILSTIARLDIVSSDNPTLQKNALTQARDLLIDFDGGVIIINSQGICTVTEPFRPDLLGQDFSGRAYFQRVRQLRAFTFSDVIQEEGSGEDIIVVAVPILSRDGEFRGAVAGRFYVQFQRIGEEIRKLSRGGTGEAYLIDRNGRVIYHPSYALIGADFSQRVSVANLMRGERQGAVIVEGPDGVRQVVGYAAVGVTGWGLVVQEPWAVVVAPAIQSLQPVIAALLVGVVLLMVILSMGVQRIVGPITEMAAYARLVAAGDYAVHVPSHPVRELRDMAAAFNEMVEQISRFQDGMRQYVAAITRSQEEERRRIARDLHDDTTQALIAIGQRVELARDLIGESPTEAVEQLRDLRKMVTRTIESVRQFSRDLRPTALEDLGLIPALQYLVNNLSQKGGVSATLEVEGSPDGLPPDLEVTLYRILQECLMNVHKHAHAKTVTVRAEFLPQLAVLTVTDDGDGFSVPVEMADLAREGHYGLLGLRERAQLFGGQIIITSQPGEGTQVQAILPRHLPLMHAGPATAGPARPPESVRRDHKRDTTDH
jgi:two-component system sensor histidine kinase DegS